MIEYCETCGKEVKTRKVRRKEVYTVFGESVEVNAEVLVCTDCGDDVFCEKLDSETLVKAYNEYRRRHKLLLPDEIRQIREQYGLSQRSFAKLLNWGDKTICRYENGAIQDKAHNSLLLFLRSPRNMRTYLIENEVPLGEKQKKKLLITVEQLEHDSAFRKGKMYFEFFFSQIPSEENGFKGFDYEKFCAMVLFFANKDEDLLKTKLMKLLHYSDMLFYKENALSMSGLKYVHLPYGPVPENFDLLIGMMEADDIAHIDISVEDGFEKHHVIPMCAIPDHAFNEKEMAVLERVYEKFKDFGSAEISDYSHKEKGYTSTHQDEIISYAYAKYIEI